jgi:hypothetical protein
MDVPGMDARAVAHKAMKIAADMCIYTNDTFMVETVQAAGSEGGAGSDAGSPPGGLAPAAPGSQPGPEPGVR